MSDPEALSRATPAFRLMLATSWLAPGAWEPRQAAAIREAVAAGPDWEEYLRLVRRHRIPVLAGSALERVPDLALPAPVRDQLARWGKAARMQALLHVQTLAEGLRTFAQAGIPVMPLKGPLLSLQLYGDLTVRQARDLDLMIPLEAFPQARNVLEDVGWVLEEPAFPLTPRQWQAYFQHEHHLSYQHRGTGVHLELHWRSHEEEPSQVQRYWQRSSTTVWQDCPYQAMDPVDQALSLCSHGGRHEWMRAKWLGDLARIFAQEELDWPAVLAEAKISRQVPALLQTLELLEILHALPRPELPGHPWQSLPRSLVACPLKALMNPNEAWERGARGPFMARWHGIWYHRLLQPQQTFGQLCRDLAYTSLDFQVLRLPDAFFWAYAPLRPFLWLCRRIKAATAQVHFPRRGVSCLSGRDQGKNTRLGD